MRTIRVMLAIVAMGLTLSACATRNFAAIDNLRRDGGQPRILLMPPDVELFELTAAGLPEINAVWTTQGRTHVDEAVAAYLRDNKAVFLRYKPPAEGSEDHQVFGQMQKMHAAVGATIQRYHMNEATRLPTKKDKFDWSLGPAAARLGAAGQADYALFIHVRDSYASAGRAAMKFMAAALLGVYVPGGMQIGHASLVDLKTGQVVWYNFLFREAGELRQPGPAKESVAMLLDNLPK